MHDALLAHECQQLQVTVEVQVCHYKVLLLHVDAEYWEAVCKDLL